jgi:subtilisin family serine protease
LRRAGAQLRAQKGVVPVAAVGNSDLDYATFAEGCTVVPGTWGCFQGTSMASPHAAGVVALIVSQFEKLVGGDVKLAPDAAQSRLQSTVIDQGLPGYDECFGHGRIDALRAVKNDTSSV